MTAAVPPSHAPLLAPGKLELKYLFGAHLANGQEIFQTSDDVSLSTSGRPASYDLKARDEHGHLLEGPDGLLLHRPDITLFQLEGNGCRYLVDLTDGHFEVTGYDRAKRQAPFFVTVPPLGSSLRLVFFLRRRQHVTLTGVVQEDQSVAVTNRLDAGQECEYHFGWQTEDGLVRAVLILV